MPSPLIGLSGYARSGKDETVAALARHGYKRLSFADNLRDLAAASRPAFRTPGPSATPFAHGALDNIVRIYGWEAAKQVPAIRQYLQDLGLGARKVFGDDIWIDALHRQRIPGNRYVITDVRFPNEAEYVRSRGGIMVRVNRPGTTPVNGHESETAIDDWPFDVYLTNDGSMQDLADAAELLLSK